MEPIDIPTTEAEQAEMNRAQVTGKPSAIVDNDDVVELGIDGLGTLSNPVVDA